MVVSEIKPFLQEAMTLSNNNSTTPSKLLEFLGPVETIISEIQEHKVDIFDVDLTALAVAFEKNTDRTLAVGAKFIAGLAHLLYLKALKLIPIEISESPETSFEIARELFLEEYSAFKEVARVFSLKEKEQSYHFPRKPLFETFEPAKRELGPPITLEQFSDLFAQILEQAQKRNVTISEDSYRLSDIMDELKIRLNHARLAFTELFSSEFDKPLLIVTFLAVLELIKNQQVRLVFEASALFVEKTTVK